MMQPVSGTKCIVIETRDIKLNGATDNGVSFDSTQERPNGTSQDEEKVVSRKLPYEKTNKKYVVFVCAFMNYFLVGGFNAMIGVIFVDIVRAFDASRSETSLMQSLSRGFIFGGGILGDILFRRFGVAKCIVGGSILASSCLLASSFATNITMIVILIGVGAGCGLMLPIFSTYITVQRAFEPALFPRFVAYTVAGGGVGQIILPYMAELMLEEYGWQGTFMLMSGIFLNIVIFGVAIGFYLPRHKIPASLTKKTYCDFSILKSHMFLTVVIIACPFGLSGFFETWYIPDYLVTIGYTREQGSILLTVVGASSAFGRFLAGFVNPICVRTKTEIIYHWVYVHALLAFAHAMYPLFPDYYILFPASILYGTLFGMIRSQSPPIVVKAVGRSRYSRAVGLENTIYGLSSSVGGVVAGAIVDSTGTYRFVFFFATICASLCSVLAGIFLVRDVMRRTSSKETKVVESTYL